MGTGENDAFIFAGDAYKFAGKEEDFISGDLVVSYD